MTELFGAEPWMFNDGRIRINHHDDTEGLICHIFVGYTTAFWVRKRERPPVVTTFLPNWIAI